MFAVGRKLEKQSETKKVFQISSLQTQQCTSQTAIRSMTYSFFKQNAVALSKSIFNVRSAVPSLFGSAAIGSISNCVLNALSYSRKMIQHYSAYDLDCSAPSTSQDVQQSAQILTAVPCTVVYRQFSFFLIAVLSSQLSFFHLVHDFFKVNLLT